MVHQRNRQRQQLSATAARYCGDGFAGRAVPRGVYVNYGASVAGAVVIGDHATLGAGCIVGHDTVVGEYAIVAPGAVISGFVRLESNCYVGAAVMVRQKVRIGAGALVGIGAVVIRDVEKGATVAGNPARVLPAKPRPSEI